MFRILYTRALAASSAADPTVEFVEFTIESILGTDHDNTGSFGTTGFGGGDEAQSSGFHGYQLNCMLTIMSLLLILYLVQRLSSSQVVHETNGELQLVSPSFGPQFKITIPYNSIHPKVALGIFLTDPIDWVMDYFNGVLVYTGL